VVHDPFRDLALVRFPDQGAPVKVDRVDHAGHILFLGPDARLTTDRPVDLVGHVPYPDPAGRMTVDRVRSLDLDLAHNPDPGLGPGQDRDLDPGQRQGHDLDPGRARRDQAIADVRPGQEAGVPTIREAVAPTARVRAAVVMPAMMMN
jgi:hypothetical protein